MERRSFFRALFGAPVIAGAAVTLPKAPAPQLRGRDFETCECGFGFERRVAFLRADQYDGARGGVLYNIPADNPLPSYEYMVCVNAKCRQFAHPLALSLIHI